MVDRDTNITPREEPDFDAEWEKELAERDALEEQQLQERLEKDRTRSEEHRAQMLQSINRRIIFAEKKLNRLYTRRKELSKPVA